MNHRKAALLLLIILPAYAWSESIGFTLAGGANLPYDPLGLASTAPYNRGGGVVLTANYELPFAPLYFVQALVGIDLIQIRSLPGYSMSMLAAGPGAGVSLRLASRVRIELGADAGYMLATYNEAWSSSWFIMTSAQLLFSLNPSFGIGAGVSYKYFSALYSGVDIFIAARFQVEIEDM